MLLMRTLCNFYLRILITKKLVYKGDGMSPIWIFMLAFYMDFAGGDEAIKKV